MKCTGTEGEVTPPPYSWRRTTLRPSASRIALRGAAGTPTPPPPSRRLQNRGNYVNRAAGAAGVVGTDQAAAAGDADDRRRQRRVIALVDFEVEQLSEERLVGGRQQQRVAEGGKIRRTAQQFD